MASPTPQHARRPTIRAVSDNTALISGPIPNRRPTNDRTPTITGRLAAPLGRGETLRLYNGKRLLGTAKVNNRRRTWSFTAILPSSSGNSFTIRARVRNAAGKLGIPSAPRSFVLDTAAASLTISDSVSGIAASGVPFTFAFSEPVSGFTADDIVVSGGTRGPFSGSGASYTLLVMPNPNSKGSITVNVAAAAAADAAGNPSAAAAQASQAFDTRIGIDLSAVALGDGGFVINGQAAGDFSGSSVASAGDVNGDGLIDLLVGAASSDSPAGGDAGRSYVVFGRTSTTAINLSAIANGNGGFVINGQANGDRSGDSVASAGDINGDGLADLLIGAHASDPTAGISAGRSYVVFGRTSSSTVNLSAIANGNGGFVINGQAAFDNSGDPVASAGDVNGDGLADLLIGAPSSSPAGVDAAGRSYVIFGKTNNAAIDLSAIANGGGGFVINGQAAGDNSGFSVASAGDVNGDGLADLLIGARGSDLAGASAAGRSYVVFGKASATAVHLSAITNGNGGFVINGQAANDLSGRSVAGAGDVNGDGLADLLIGAYGSDPVAGNQAGRSYVIFGKATTAAVDLSAIANGSGGFAINGQAADDASGASVARAGDVNGDGLADLLIGAPGADPADSTNAGRSYVLFGSTAGPFSTSSKGTGMAYGGSGNDRFNLAASMVTALQAPLGAGGNTTRLARVDGGSGIDTLAINGSGLRLNLTQVASQSASNTSNSSRLTSIEAIDLSGTGNNALTLTDIRDLSPFNWLNSSSAPGLGFASGSFALPASQQRHQLLITGNAGDSLRLLQFSVDGGWLSAGAISGTGPFPGIFNVFNSSSGFSQLIVSQLIATSFIPISSGGGSDQITFGAASSLIS
ncbi:MAG: beta strand repeat-containing protein [Cyanobacteriota bacterium]